MSDPRNVAHAKKVTQGKKHKTEPSPGDRPAAQPGKKSAAASKKDTPAPSAAAPVAAAPEGLPLPDSAPATRQPATLAGSLVVLTKLKELEFHSRAHLERLAELSMTVEDELKQTTMVGPLGEVYSAQNTFQTKLSALIESYKDECDRLQLESGGTSS